jgi:hypothetical protein
MARIHGSGERWPYAEMLLEVCIGRSYRYGSDCDDRVRL